MRYVWFNLKTIKFYLLKLAKQFYWQPSYLQGERSSRLRAFRLINTHFKNSYSLFQISFFCCKLCHDTFFTTEGATESVSQFKIPLLSFYIKNFCFHEQNVFFQHFRKVKITKTSLKLHPFCLKKCSLDLFWVFLLSVFLIHVKMCSSTLGMTETGLMNID